MAARIQYPSLELARMLTRGAGLCIPERKGIYMERIEKSCPQLLESGVVNRGGVVGVEWSGVMFLGESFVWDMMFASSLLLVECRARHSTVPSCLTIHPR